ncbi:MAG TPA: type IV pilus twitching motility protein PilT [Gammaproteobacteria bacterium]|nr:type IV pilus twitching motility protein PilT [Gammaproteobacteria bacterium]
MDEIGKRINAFLEMVVEQGGSDLHLVSGNPPRMRLFGEIYPIKYRKLTENEVMDLLTQVMSEQKRSEFEAHGGADFSYEVTGLSRFRVNIFRHVGGVGAVFRTIPEQIVSVDELRLPSVIKTLAHNKKGLILVTGPTGSGKSTTLASIIDLINTERKGHIITIEDPIEYSHKNKNCLVSQREIGTHTDSFAHALRSALREDPDAILVGEMRDLDTISLAVTAAEMGVLVLGTLHTNCASATIDRIINVFPSGDEPYIRTMLSTSLCGIIAQRLVRTVDNRGRLAAVEVLVNNTAVANIIRVGRPEQLDNVIQSSAMQGMQTLDSALRKLLDEKLISGIEAYKHASNKAQFEQYRLLQDEMFN